MAAQDEYFPHNPHPEHEVVTLLSWDGPGRPFRKRGKSYFSTALLITLLVEIILFLFSQYLLMLVVMAFVFLAVVLATVPPHDFHYKISTQGIQVEDHYFLWQELYDFYFTRIHGVDVMHVRTKTMYPGELTVTLGHISPAHLKTILLPYLPYREYVKPTFMEKSATWLSRTFPLETTKTQ